MSIATAIHIGQFNGKPIRFFTSPIAGPQLVWHAQDDLYQCLGFDADTRATFMRLTARDWADETRVVATDAGPVRIAPHFMAQGIIAAAPTIVKIDRTEDELLNEYATVAGTAMQVVTADMTSEDSFNFLILAVKNQGGAA